MKYQTLYRKYRPKNFDEVVGQKITIKILKNAIMNDHISHAYLFYGPRGTGKTSIAKILARTINCQSPKNGIPCEECESCKISRESGCTDIIEIDAASNNGVDEIRELKSKISFVPSELKYKIYIIDEVHMLSTGAFNALLKTLEEPPEYSIFILATTELQKVPLTIISRCQTLEFKKIDNKSMYDKLRNISNRENILIDDSGIYEIINNSNGGLRDAIGLLDKAYSYEEKIDSNIIREISGNISKESLDSFIKLLKNNDINLVLKKINEFNDNGVDLIKLANNIVTYFRDEMIENKIYDEDKCNLIIELDNIVSKMEKSQNPKILLEVTIINYLSKKNCVKIDGDNYDSTNNSSKVLNNKIVDDKQIKKNNLEEIKTIRISNTLCKPDKLLISTIRKEWIKLKDYAFDEEFGNIARILSSDILPVAASSTNLILVSKLLGIANQLNNDIDNIEKLIFAVFKSSYKIICLSDDEWQKCIKDYKNNKDKFKYITENDNNNNAKTLKQKAKELFD